MGLSWAKRIWLGNRGFFWKALKVQIDVYIEQLFVVPIIFSISHFNDDENR